MLEYFVARKFTPGFIFPKIVYFKIDANDLQNFKYLEI